MALQQLASALLGNIDVVLFLPLVPLVVSLALRYFSLITWTLAECVYVAGSLFLALGYAFAFSVSEAPVIAIALLAPQVIILIVMVLGFLFRRLYRHGAEPPALWLAIMVAVLGHAWTRFYLYSLANS